MTTKKEDSLGKKLLRKVYYSLVEVDKYSPSPMLFPIKMTKGEKNTFVKWTKESDTILEFGAGGSTFLSLLKSHATVHSLDSSLEWIDLMRGYKFIKKMEGERLFLYHIDIGPTGAWGYPSGNSSPEQLIKYSSEIFKKIDKSSIDTVFVDGRFRVACVLKSILELKENKDLKILIHDFWNRKEYHLVLEYLREIDRADKLGVFHVRKDVDLEEVAATYEKYKLEAR